MTYYGGKDLAAAFRTVRRNTVRIAEDIPEDKYGFRASPDTRSIGQLLVHIGLSTSFWQHIHGNRIADVAKVNFPELMQKNSAEEAKPRNKAAIIAVLKSEGEAFAALLEGSSDAFLSEPVAMMPGAEPATKTRFELLLSAKEHEMHHRAQLMLIERMIGVVPHLTREREQRMAAAQASRR